MIGERKMQKDQMKQKEVMMSDITLKDFVEQNGISLTDIKDLPADDEDASAGETTVFVFKK
jgi:hypothetical protein